MSLKGRTREIVLSAVLLVVLFYYLRPAPPGSRPDDRTKTAEARDLVMELMARWDSYGSVEDIRGGAGDEGRSTGRNPFEFGSPPVKQPTPEELAAIEAARRAAAEAEKLRQEEAARLREEALRRQREAEILAAQNAARDVKPPPPAKPVPPSINLKYIGVVGETDDRIAIFLDGTQFLMARQGETVKEDFRIEKISYDILEMGFTDPRFSGETRLMPMGE